jgi:hypothetical protein
MFSSKDQLFNFITESIPTPDITDRNQNNPDDVTPNIEISKQPTPDITVLNQNNTDDVTPNIEISNQPTPNCISGEGIPDITSRSKYSRRYDARKRF